MNGSRLPGPMFAPSGGGTSSLAALPSAPVWLPLSLSDIADVAAIAAQLHPSLPERTAVLAEKAALFPEGCRKLLVDGRMCGYGLAHPWRMAVLPALDAFLDALPVAADCLFIHDVAVLPQARGRGAAASFILHADVVTMQHNLPAQALVAAYGSVRLWQRFGFAPLQGDHSVAKLAAYGAGAVYMSRAVASPPAVG